MDDLLLDTHALLWWLEDSPRMSRAARAAIASPEQRVFVSAVTVWEIALKRNLGKLQAPDNLLLIIREEGFTGLPLTLEHGYLAGNLPLIHRDPFDRMLIAQAQIEGLILVTDDATVQRYDVATLAA